MSRPSPDNWIATTAHVTTCRYQFARLNTFYLGIQTTRKFRITADYYAHARLYSTEFQSDVAIPQDTPLPVSYNPLKPAQNTLAPIEEPPSRSALFAFGIAGSLILSLLWFAILRGCS